MSTQAHTPNFSKAKLTKVFVYLDRLRESGITNMYGASPYVQDAFNMKRDDATAALRLWMKSFSDEPPAVRAAIARAEGQP